MRRISQFSLGMIVCAAILSACATQPVPGTSDAPGFWHGLLHGFMILISLIGSIFTDYRIYAFPNSGFGYDLGYVFGALMFLGGTGAGARQVQPANPPERVQDSPP
jgi:hypothetical protein